MAFQAGKKNILIVDDDRLIVSLLEAGLTESDSDYAVTTALSASEALLKLSQAQFELVMTDYQMPDMNGVELIGKIRALSPATPIVLMSAHPPDVMEEMVGKIQAEGYLEKPISLPKLWQMVESVLR